MLPTNSLQFFQNARDFRPFTAGEVIFEEGQPGNVMYVVKEGRVDITIRDKHVETVEAGGIFGEMALIDKTTRSATATAKSPCKLIPINEERFKFLIQQTPMFSLHVMRVLAYRLRRADVRLGLRTEA